MRTAQPEVISVGRDRLGTSKVGIGCCDNSCVWVEIAEALYGPRDGWSVLRYSLLTGKAQRRKGSQTIRRMQPAIVKPQGSGLAYSTIG